MSSEYDYLKRLIRARREERAAQQQAKAFRLKAIRVAADYEQWLQTNERGDSFSAFINEFGYQETDGSIMHKIVKRIFEAATLQ